MLQSLPKATLLDLLDPKYIKAVMVSKNQFSFVIEI